MKLICIFLLIFSPITFAKEFLITPYFIKKANQSVILNFSLRKGLLLHVNNFKIQEPIPKFFQKTILHKIDLGQLICGQENTLIIKDSNSQKVLFKNQFKKSSYCKKESHPFYFGFISDTQDNQERHAMVSKVIEKEIKNIPFNFILNTGDIVHNGDIKYEWLSFLKTASPYMRKIPLIAAIGNHGYRGHRGPTLPPLFKKYLRAKKTDPYGNMSLRFPHFQMIVFNGNFFEMSKKVERLQWAWIEKEILAAKKNNLMVAIGMHFPVYSSSLNKYFSQAVRKNRKYLVKLVEKYKVELVLSGHTHMYERSFKKGVTYLVAGPAGGRANTPSASNKYNVFIDYKSLTFTKVKVLPSKFLIKTLNQTGQVIDKFSIQKRFFKTTLNN